MIEYADLWCFDFGDCEGHAPFLFAGAHMATFPRAGGASGSVGVEGKPVKAHCPCCGAASSWLKIYDDGPGYPANVFCEWCGEWHDAGEVVEHTHPGNCP